MRFDPFLLRRGSPELLSICRNLMPAILSAVSSAAGEASTGVGSWRPVSDALVAARRLSASCTPALNAPPGKSNALPWFTAQICELAFSQLFAVNPAVKLQVGRGVNANIRPALPLLHVRA